MISPLNDPLASLNNVQFNLNSCFLNKGMNVAERAEKTSKLNAAQNALEEIQKNNQLDPSTLRLLNDAHRKVGRVITDLEEGNKKPNMDNLHIEKAIKNVAEAIRSIQPKARPPQAAAASPAAAASSAAAASPAAAAAPEDRERAGRIGKGSGQGIYNPVISLLDIRETLESLDPDDDNEILIDTAREKILNELYNKNIPPEIFYLLHQANTVFLEGDIDTAKQHINAAITQFNLSVLLSAVKEDIGGIYDRETCLSNLKAILTSYKPYGDENLDPEEDENLIGNTIAIIKKELHNKNIPPQISQILSKEDFGLEDIRAAVRILEKIKPEESIKVEVEGEGEIERDPGEEGERKEGEKRRI